jgi:hypothetical protein
MTGTEKDESPVEEPEVEESEAEASETEAPVVEKSVDELKSEIEALTAKLRKANRQAAERRIQLKEVKGKAPETAPETNAEEATSKDAVAAELRKVRNELRAYKLSESLAVELDAMSLSFASAQARTDVLAFARDVIGKEFGDDVTPVKEDLVDTLKEILRTRPYLTAPRKTPVETDSKKRGTKTDSLQFDEEEIARAYGIRPL